MKSAAARDEMVRKVKAAADKWPRLVDMPVGGEPSKGMSIVTVPVPGAAIADNSVYIATLYEMGAKGMTAIGRAKDMSAIIGEVKQ